MREDLFDRLEESRRAAKEHLAAATRSLEELRATQERWATGRPRREQLHDSVLARLEARLASQPVIEQAKGIIMCRSRCTAEEAFSILRRASQRSNVPVRELAAQMVERVAQRPPPPPART